MKSPKKNNDCSLTRRGFLLGTAGGIAAGAGVQAAGGASRGSRQRLALFGGRPAVTVPADKHDKACRWPLFGPEEERAVLQVVRHPTYGPIDAFERDWKNYCGAPFVKAHYNGTSALTSMFFALDLPPGSEIMVPSYTFFATILPMRFFGFVPVFVDIDPHTLNFDLQDAKKRLTKRTKALLPVHWLGLPCDMDAICDFAREKGLIVLEDAAHAHGAKLKGKRMGLWSRMSIFSFQNSKPLPTIEGGMGMYQTREDYERATTFGHYRFPPRFPAGSRYRRYQGTGLGLKLRMHPIAAAIGRAQLRTLDKRNALIKAQVRRLNDQITTLPGLSEQRCRSDADRVYYAYNMLFLDEKKAGMSRKAVVKALRAEGVRTSEYSYLLQHKCAVYRETEWWHHKPEIPHLPGSEEANKIAINLPLFTSEAPELVEQYAEAFKKVWAHRNELASI